MNKIDLTIASTEELLLVIREAFLLGSDDASKAGTYTKKSGVELCKLFTTAWRGFHERLLEEAYRGGVHNAVFHKK